MGLFDPFVEAAEGFIDAAKSGGEAVVDGAEEAWNAVTGATEDAANAAAETAEDVWNALTGAAEDAAKAAAEAAEDAAKAAAKAAEDAARALENAVNDTYEWGSGAADTLATGVADAAEWGIGAFETVGKAFVEDIDWEEVGAQFSSGVTEFANRFFGGEDTKKFEDKSFASDGIGPYFGKDAGSQFANGGGEDEPIGRVGQALGSTNPGPDLSNIVTTLDEARANTGFGGVPLVEGEGEGGSSSFAQLLSDGYIADQPESPLGNASDAGIIVVGGHDGPGAAFTDATPHVAAVSIVRDISSEHRELARETVEGVELPNAGLEELANREPFNERPFELPGLDGLLGGRDPLGWLDGKGGYGGPNGLGGLPGGLGGDGWPGGFEGLPGWLGGRGGPGDLSGFPGGFGGPSGDGAPIGEGGFGGELGGFGGLPGWVTGNGKGGLDGLFGGGPRDWGSAGGFGIDLGGSSGTDGLGIGLPPDLGGSRMPDIKLKGEDVMWHEEGKNVVADKGETLAVQRGNNTFTVSEGKSFEKHEGDSFTSTKEPNTFYHVSDGKAEKAGGSNSGGTTDDKPHPGDPKGMPADGGSGGGPNWSPYAMPADDGSGGGPNWSPYAMPADDGSGGGPVWSTLMPADDSVGGGGPNWSVHDSFAVAALADTQPTTGDHQFASAFSVIDSHFSHDSMSAIGSHLWF